MSVKLNYESVGSGPSIIILHGLFGSSRNWTSFANKLAERFRVINVDLRNHGQSEHTDSMTYTDMVQDIEQVLSECNLQQVGMLGHSLGGKVAMSFALQKHAYVSHLMVLDIAPVSYQHEFRHLLDAMQQLPLPNINSRAQADEYLAKDIPEPGLRQFLLQNLKQEQQSYQWRINLDAIRKSLVDMMNFNDLDTKHSFHNPVLFLSSERSDYIKPEYHSVIYQYFPQAQIDTIADAGHWLHVDQPNIVFEKIKNFFTED